jgi:hypothetical protein
VMSDYTSGFPPCGTESAVARLMSPDAWCESTSSQQVSVSEVGVVGLTLSLFCSPALHADHAHESPARQRRPPAQNGTSGADASPRHATISATSQGLG